MSQDIRELKLVRTSKWFYWRDITLLGLIIVIVILASAVSSLQAQLQRSNEASVFRSNAATADRARLEDQLTQLNAQLVEDQRQSARKDATIAALAAALKQAGVDPAPFLRATANAKPSQVELPTPSSAPQPSPTSPSPGPKPQPSPSPSPSAPTPSPTCHLRVLEVCVTR